MKIEYKCEVCGKSYPTAKEADNCEKQHQVEERKVQLKEKSEAAISKLINQHIKEFREIPEIKLDSENRHFVTKCAVDIPEDLCDESDENDIWRCVYDFLS